MVIEDFVREVSVFLAHLSINDPEKEKIEEGRKILSLVLMNVFLKKGFLREKLSMSSLFINTIYAAYAVLIIKKRTEQKEGIEERLKEKEEGLFLLMKTLNNSYTELIKTTNNIFYRLEMEVFSSRHPSSSAFFPSLSVLVKGSQMLVYERILLVLFRRTISLVGRKEEVEGAKETFDSLIKVVFHVSWNLIDLTLLKKTLDTSFIEKMLALILKIILEALAGPLKITFLEVLRQKSFKGLKFLIKILFIILFEKINFEDFEIKRQEGEEEFLYDRKGRRTPELKDNHKRTIIEAEEEDEVGKRIEKVLNRQKEEEEEEEIIKEGWRSSEEEEEGERRWEGKKRWKEKGVYVVVEEGGKEGKEKCVNKMLEV